MLHKFKIFPADIGIVSKVFFILALTMTLAGCYQDINSPITTSERSPTISANNIDAESPTSTPKVDVSPTEPSPYPLDGNGQYEIIFAEFGPDNKGLYITLPFNKWTSHQIVSNQSGLAFYHFPSLSPDGTKFIFAYDDGGGFRIYTMAKDGSDLQLVVHADNILPYQRYPSWSPDGSQIIFTVFNKLYIADSNGQSIQMLAEVRSLSYPAWSPDGKQIAFLADKKDDQSGLKLFTIDKDGKNMQALTDAIADDSKISWSPDGKQIAFRSLDGCGDISVIQLASGTTTNITKTPYMEKDPAWSPDGNYIAFASSSYTGCENYVAESPYILSTLFLADVRSQIIIDPMLLKGVETALYEPSWWPSVILQPNWKYSVTNAGSSLNVRESPSLSATSLAKLPQGALFTALEGPVFADNYQWWHIRTDSGIEGWCVDVPGWYMLEKAE